MRNRLIPGVSGGKMASGTADERGSKSPKRKLIFFFVALKNKHKVWVFLYATRIAKIKCFYIVFVVLLFFCKALNVCREGRQKLQYKI